MINALHGKVPRHELHNRAQSCHGSANSDTGKTMLGDRRINHAAGAKFLQQTLGNLIRTLIFRDLFAHHENVAVAAHFLSHCVPQRFAHCHGHKSGSGGVF